MMTFSTRQMRDAHYIKSSIEDLCINEEQRKQSAKFNKSSEKRYNNPGRARPRKKAKKARYIQNKD